jgi:hypothetical protein
MTIGSADVLMLARASAASFLPTAGQVVGSIFTDLGERNRRVAPRNRDGWPSRAGDDIRRGQGKGAVRSVDRSG